jgi:hypothetical protein
VKQRPPMKVTRRHLAAEKEFPPMEPPPKTYPLEPPFNRHDLSRFTPYELHARVALALVRQAYKLCPADFRHPPSGVLLLAIRLRDTAPLCCYFSELSSLAKHLALGQTSKEWAYLWCMAEVNPLRSRAKQRLS